MNMRGTIMRRATGTDFDIYGNPVETESVAKVRCFVYQTKRSEIVISGRSASANGADIDEETFTGFFPAGTVLGAGDAVMVSGYTYEVQGPPWNATNPRTNRAAYVMASLHRTS